MAAPWEVKGIKQPFSYQALKCCQVFRAGKAKSQGQTRSGDDVDVSLPKEQHEQEMTKSSFFSSSEHTEQAPSSLKNEREDSSFIGYPI